MDGIQPGTQQGYSGVTNAHTQQFGPQGFFGSLLGAPLGGVIGSGIGGLLGSQSIGRNIGQTLGGIGGGLLPFGTDPVTAAYLQQVQLAQLAQQQQQPAPQGLFGNILGSIGRPLGGMIGGALGMPHLGGQIGGFAGQIGRLLPFGVDPVTAAYAEQAQLAQLAPQEPPGNILGAVGRPLGSWAGGLFGSPGIGGQIGAGIGQLGRLLPFEVDPVTAAYVQQVQLAQLAQQQQQQQQLQGQIGPQSWMTSPQQWGTPVGRTVPFQTAGYGQQPYYY